ncbi:DUF4178 domain-containing protein [Rubricoccus marinus]|uniref:DUF4178 domain-containing protein n=1 Tax=Rubricoccus marinus TaxID=716817 RepID=A0A259U1T2_9BACT|nr:DUF4178 domain-containing protein [Rubricoccus marinus]OZC03921.1 hypothetical protein BSZ36_13585 [Rubricoccus marinus]
MMELSPLDRALRAARRGHNVAARTLLDDILAADPAHEEALLWRARVAEDDAERAGFLQRVLAVNPQNAWAAQQLAASGGAEAASGARGQDGVPDTLTCSNCGGSVEVHPERGSKAAMCTYCGSVLDLGTTQLDVIGQMNPKVGPKHPIKPGDEATFFGENHLVMGWMRYKGWDSEDSWHWDEWQLVSDSGVPRYLSHSSDEGWTIQTPIRPTPEVSRSGIKLKEGKAGIKESGPAKITAMQGEFTFRPRLDKTLKVIEASRGDQHYSAELTGDELEVVGGPRVPERELWAAFGREDKLREMDARAERARKRRKALRSAALLCFLAAGAYFMGIGWASSKDGSTVSSGTTEFVSDLSDVPVLPSRSEFTAERRDSLSLGTVEVVDASEVYEVVVATPHDGLYPYPAAEVYIEEPDGDVVNLGRLTNRSDGYELKRAFRPNAVGSHTLLMFVEERSPDRLTFTTTVRTGMWDPGPFAVACGLAVLLGLVLFLAGGFGRID